tara:strand:+ start:9469 stop:10332 length:864 start_codon:yes stop_codon:yes gene_type:complete
MSSKITRGEISAIKRLLQSGKLTAPLNKTWQRIHSEEAIGRAAGKKIHFTSREIERLQQHVSASAGIEALTADLSGDRMTIARTSSDEKLSSVGVFAGLIKVARKGLVIPTLSGDAFTPPATMLSVPGDAIDLSKIDQIVVIENGAAIRYWADILLPEMCTGALFVYRGHSSDVSIVSDLVQRAADAGVATYAFFDFDPAGLAMAARSGCDYAFVPRDWKLLIAGSKFVERFNKLEVYLDQAPQLREILNGKQAWIQDIASHLQKHRLAITQEHLLANHCPLTMFRL